MFGLTPPEGYTVETTAMEAPSKIDPCEAAASLLRAYANRADGRFPKSLTDWGDLAIVMSKDSKNGELGADAKQAMTNAGILSPSLVADAKGKDYDYTPGDTRLGDAGKIVFWSRSKDGRTYRAVFGDLSVRNVTQAEVAGH